MNKYVSKWGLVVFLGLYFQAVTLGQGISENAFKADYSMSFKQFKEQALQAKDEIWVVDFWASWCRPCLEILPELIEIEERYEGKKVRFISISYDEDKKDWVEAIEYFRIPWQQICLPNPRAEDPFINKNFKHKFLPTLFLVTPEGKVKKTDDVLLPQLLDKQLAKMQ